MWIYGASGHGKVILDCLLANGTTVKGFIDDDEEKKSFMDYPVRRLNKVNLKKDKVILGIGDNFIRKSLSESLNVNFRTVIHPSAVVSPNAVIGIGTVIIPQAVVNSGSKIGDHCIINTRASVGHDCTIGDYVHIAPGVTISGNVSVGPLSWIGAGATVVQDVKIGNNVLIGAGSVVVRDIPDNSVAMGVPARVVRLNNSAKKTNVYIIGASGFGREIESWINQSDSFKRQYEIKGYLDDNLKALDGFPSDYKVLGKIDEFVFNEGDMALLTIADPKIKENIVRRLNGRVKFLSFISEKAITGKNIDIGEGTIIGPDCILTSNIKIGKYVSIIIGSIVGHDSVVSDFSSVMVHIEISGNVHIGKSTFIGSNSTIIPGITIGERSKIGAGSIVIADLPPKSFAYGNPAKNYSKLIK